MPQKYYMDWLEVADDEIRHFKMLESILHEVGYKYVFFIYFMIFNIRIYYYLNKD
ncbi:MAG: ferritin-like domain-containing protein [Sulfurovum sp.]|nr:MAG: ferritin-like domain-containing protein [Sulfurovum sp.]